MAGSGCFEVGGLSMSRGLLRVCRNTAQSLSQWTGHTASIAQTECVLVVDECQSFIYPSVCVWYSGVAAGHWITHCLHR